MDIAKGKIGNALTSTAQDHVVAVANDIYDETQEKYQSEINAEVGSKKVLSFGGIVDDVTVSTGTLPRTPGAESIFFDKTKGYFVARVWIMSEPTLGGSSVGTVSISKYYKAWNGSDKYNKVTDSGIVPACNSFIDITTMSSDEIESLLDAKANKTDLENILYFDEEIDAPDDKDVIDKVNDLASNKVDKTSEEELTIQANEITLKSDNGIKIESSSDNDIYIGNNTRNVYLDIDTEDGIVSSFGERLQLSADDSISIISNANEVTIGSGLPDTGIRLTSDRTSYFKESGDIEIMGGSLTLEGNTFNARFQSTMEISNGGQEEEWHGISVKNRVLKMQGDSAELSADGGIDIKGGDSLNLEVYNNSNIIIGTNNQNTRIDINGQSKQISFYASDVSFNTAVDFSERATIQGDSIATQEYVDDKVGEEFNRVDDDINEVANGDYGVPDYEALPLLCGQPPILFGAGTPQEAVVPTNWKQFADGGYNWNGLPSAIGQVYINTSATSNGRYTAYQEADGTLAWLNF